MSREELLEHHIYIPEVVDDRIKAHLLMGDSVLVWGDSVHNSLGKSLYKLHFCDAACSKFHFMQFCLCLDEDLEDIYEHETGIISENYVMWDLLLNREDVENIKDMFYDEKRIIKRTHIRPV